jgi:hypothetical protein
MPSDVQPSVSFHAVRDAATVRAVVEAIGALGRPGLRALGSATGHGEVVAVEAETVADAVRGRKVVRLLDPRSRRLEHDAPESWLRGDGPSAMDRVAG